MPRYRRFFEAWDEHPQRDLLDTHKRKYGRERSQGWRFVRGLHEDGWGEYRQRPTDPRDGREGRDTVAAAIAAAGSTVDHGPHQV